MKSWITHLFCLLGAAGGMVFIWSEALVAIPERTASDERVQAAVELSTNGSMRTGCIDVTVRNPTGGLLILRRVRVTFLDHAGMPLSEADASEYGVPLAPRQAKVFEICGGPNMRVKEWSGSVRVNVPVDDYSAYNRVCSRVKLCDANPQNKMLLSQPYSCEKMFASLDRNQQTRPMIPGIIKCIEDSPCASLDTFQCFADAAKGPNPEGGPVSEN